MDADPNTASEPLDQVPADHPAGHEDEVLLDSPEQAAALMADEGDDGPDGAPWTDGPGHVADELPEPVPAGAGDAEDAGDAGRAEDAADTGDEVLPMSVEGVGDLVADPLSRAKVIPRDDPGGPAPDEVPPSPS